MQIGDRIELDRVPFIKKLTCKNCGLERSLLYLAAALSPALRRCSTCETHMTATGFDILESIDSRQPKKILRRSLRSIGLRQGDIFHSGNGRYFEIAGDDS